MKSTPYIAIILFFLMLLLVLGAAFIFLFQAQVTLEERLDGMAAAQETLVPLATAEAEIGNATRVALEASLSEEQASNVLLESDLVDSQQQLQQLNNELTEAELALIEANQMLTELQTQPAVVQQAAPSIQIVLAEDEALLQPLVETAVWIAAADVEGITAVSLTIDGVSIGSFEPNNERLFADRYLWTPAGGSHTLVATVESSSGSINRAERTVTVSAGEGDVVLYETTVFDQIEANIAAIRGILPETPIQRILVPEEELAQRLAERAQPAEETLRLLSAFGLDEVPLPEIVSPISFYDPVLQAIIVRNDLTELSPAGQAQYGREYFLALQDQQDNLSLLETAPSDDARMALWALAEGEANLVATQFVEQYLMGESAVFIDHNAALMNNLPGILLRLDGTPGSVATNFAQALFDSAGGYVGLEDAWLDLPTASAQVLNPAEYPGEAPEIVVLPSFTETLGSEWSVINEDSLGALGLQMWLAQQLDLADVQTAVLGWEGDTYAVYEQSDSDQLLLVLRIAWETPAASEQFDLLFNEYGNLIYDTNGASFADSAICWQGDDVLCIITEARDSLVIRAPNYSFVTAVLDQISP